MKRKGLILVGVVIAVALLAVFAAPALAAWVGSLSGEAQIINPVTVVEFKSPLVVIAPGQAYGFGGEIINDSPVKYGLRSYGWIWWTWETGEVMEISLEEVSVEGEITVPTSSIPATIAAGLVGPPEPETYLGTIELYLDGKFQSLGSIFNIEPGQVIEGKVIVTTDHSIPSGKVIAQVFFLRGAPVR